MSIEETLSPSGLTTVTMRLLAVRKLESGSLVLVVAGGLSLIFGLAAGASDAFGGYANGCGHGARIGAAAAAGVVAAVLLIAVQRTPPIWLAVALLIAMVFFVAAGSGLSTDYLANGGCRYADRAATEDAVAGGWLTFAGGVALACGVSRRRA
jgi:hypothetical protein